MLDMLVEPDTKRQLSVLHGRISCLLVRIDQALLIEELEGQIS